MRSFIRAIWRTTYGELVKCLGEISTGLARKLERINWTQLRRKLLLIERGQLKGPNGDEGNRPFCRLM